MNKFDNPEKTPIEIFPRKMSLFARGARGNLFEASNLILEVKNFIHNRKTAVLTFYQITPNDPMRMANGLFDYIYFFF